MFRCVVARRAPARSAFLGFTRSSRAGVVALLFGLLSTVGPVQAQVQRNFPPNALRGALVIGDPPEATLNGEAARLAPGARIRDADNMIVMSAKLSGARFLVNYTVDLTGLVKEVWILTPAEAAVKPWPRTLQEAQDWSFDPIAQVWTRP
jgi:hypothetical protein